MNTVCDVKKLTLALFFCTAPLAAQNDSAARRPIPHGFPAELDAYLAKAIVDWDVPGMAIAIVRNDSVLVAKGYGVRELGKPDQVDANTIFDVASLSKSFTAAAAALLVDEGKLRWDDYVTQHLPTLRFPDPYLTKHVTLRDLLAHRTGLNPSNWIVRFWGEGRDLDALHRVPHLKTSGEFRASFVYANIGYTVAGAVIGAAGGMPWNKVVEERLLRSLGMSSSFVNGDVPASGNVARPHMVLGGRQQAIRSASGVQDGPSGGVRSTVRDMAQWLRFQINGGELDGRRLLSARVMEEMHSPQNIIPTTAAMRRARNVELGMAAYGLGWQVMDYRGRRMLWHSGSGDGLASYMAILPQQRLGVVVMLNSWNGSALHGAVAARVLDTYLGFDGPDHVAQGLTAAKAQRGRDAAGVQALQQHTTLVGAPARPLDAYAGVYEDGLYGPIHVRRDNGRLTLQFGRGEIGDLTSHGGDSMFVRWRDPIFGELMLAHVTFAPSGDRIHQLRMALARDTVTAIRRR